MSVLILFMHILANGRAQQQSSRTDRHLLPTPKSLAIPMLLVVLSVVTLSLSTHAGAYADIVPEYEIEPAIFGVSILVDGELFEASPIMYSKSHHAIIGKIVEFNDTSGTLPPNSILLVQSPESIYRTIQNAARIGASALVVYEPDGAATLNETGIIPPRYRSTIPVITTTEGTALYDTWKSDPDAAVSLIFGREGFEALDGANDLGILKIAGSVYGVVAAEDAIQIIDISVPDHPLAVSAAYARMDDFKALRGANDVEIVTISDTHYALVAGTNSIQIIDVSDPHNLVPVSSIFDNIDGFDALRGVSDMVIVERSGDIYCITASRGDDAIQVIDITNPYRPKPVGVAYDDEEGFEGLGGARGIDVITVRERLYAAVAGYDDDAVQIVDLVNPHQPLPVIAIENSTDQTWLLDGVIDIETLIDGDDTFVIAVSYHDNAIQVINMTTPHMPISTRSIVDDSFRFGSLSKPWDLELVETTNNVFGIITAHDEESVQVMDFSNPAAPRPTSIFPDENDEDDPPLRDLYGIDTVIIENVPYAVAVSPIYDKLYIMDMNQPASLDLVSEVSQDAEVELEELGGGGIEIFNINNRTYGIIVDYIRDALQIVDITNPTLPLPVSVMYDEYDDVEELDGPFDVEVLRSGDKVYALATGHYDDGIQVIDITDPALPKAVYYMNNDTDEGTALHGVRGLDIAEIAGRHYAVVASSDDDAIQIIDLVNPAFPIPVKAVYHDELYEPEDGIGRDVRVRALEDAWDVEVFDVEDHTYAIVTGYRADSVQIINITNPVKPWPVEAFFDDEVIYDMDGPGDVETYTVSGRTYALIAAKWDGAVHIINVTNPEMPRHVSSVEDNTDGIVALDGAGDVELIPVGNRMYMAVSGIVDSGIQIIDITDPADPVPVDSAYDNSRNIRLLGGASGVDTVIISGTLYVMVHGITDNGVQLMSVSGLLDSP